MFNSKFKGTEVLHPEFLKIERKRVGIILIIFVISTLMIPIMHLYIPNLLVNTLKQKDLMLNLTVWWMIFCVFEIIVYIRLTYSIKKGIDVPRKVLIPNLLFEFGLPAIFLVQIIKYDSSLLILEYDGLIFYFILQVLSIMHMDLKISIGAGVLAGITYYSLAAWGVDYLGLKDEQTLFMEIYTMRSFGLVAVGILSAIVAHEINKRVNIYIKNKNDRQEIESLLGQQLSEGVARELISHRNDKVGNKVYGSIMFLDIRNFTSMADHQSPEETIEFQNAIFDPLIRIIEKNNGIIHQILGDGFMASFGIAVKNENHIQDSYRAGIEIIEVINHLRIEVGGKKTKVGIGLHAGEVITGNIGNEIRKQFSLAGKNVIIASRMEQLNKQFNSQFLISKDFAEQLEKPVNLIDLGDEKVKGIDEKIGILKVV